LFSPLLKRSARRVARDGYRALKEGRRVVVPGSANRVVTMLAPLTPRSMLFRAMDGYRKERR
jgi:short-subunit dehydrogenase